MKDVVDEFRLLPTSAFDARRGYARWVIPGVGIQFAEKGFLAKADLWMDQHGNLFTRFTSRGYSLHFKVKSTLSDQIVPKMKDDLEEFLANILMEWVVEGVDDDLECAFIEYENAE